jgi:hypothetical protein
VSAGSNEAGVGGGPRSQRRAPSFLKTWRPSFKIRRWPEVLAAPPSPEDPTAGTQVPKIRRPTLLPQDPTTDAQGNLSLFIPWVWNSYSIPEPTRCPSAPGHFPAGACYSVFSVRAPHPQPHPIFSEYEPHILLPPSNRPVPDFFTAPLSGSCFFFFLHCMDCIVRFCVKGNIFSYSNTL